MYVHTHVADALLLWGCTWELHRNLVIKLLGHGMETSFALVGTWNGDVIRTRSIVRVVEASRWDTDFLERLKGAPSKEIPMVLTDMVALKNVRTRMQ